jgi:hypothetical protein
MDTQSVKHRDDHVARQLHCMICGAVLTSGELCRSCERRGLSPEQYAEFFWEEV